MSGRLEIRPLRRTGLSGFAPSLRFLIAGRSLGRSVSIPCAEVLALRFDAPLKMGVRSRQSPETERPTGLVCMVAGSLEEDYRPPRGLPATSARCTSAAFVGAYSSATRSFISPAATMLRSSSSHSVRSRTPDTIIDLILIPRSVGLSPQPRTCGKDALASAAARLPDLG